MDNLTLVNDLWSYFSLFLEFGLFDISTTKFGLKIIDPYFQNLGPSTPLVFLFLLGAEGGGSVEVEMAIKKLARILMKSRDDAVSLPTRDDPSFDDSRPIDSQGNRSSLKFFLRRFFKP